MKACSICGGTGKTAILKGCNLCGGSGKVQLTFAHNGCILNDSIHSSNNKLFTSSDPHLKEIVIEAL